MHTRIQAYTHTRIHASTHARMHAYTHTHIHTYILSRAINFGRQCHFKIWLDCHKFKKIEKKMTINVIQHDDRL
jgi:hypothetical protein